MKWIFNLIEWIKKETWWRPYYKRITLDGKTTREGRCLVCHAGYINTPANPNTRCNMLKGRDCPCKYNQCLKLK